MSWAVDYRKAPSPSAGRGLMCIPPVAQLPSSHGPTPPLPQRTIVMAYADGVVEVRFVCRYIGGGWTTRGL
jgi:hypothetical protein